MSIFFAILWFAVIQILVAKLRRPRFGYVGVLQPHRYPREANVRFDIISSPEQAQATPSLPLVVDFQSAPLSRQWENYLSEAVVSGRPVFDSEMFFESTEGRVRLFNLARHPIGQTPTDSIYIPAKRYIDIFVSLVSITLLSPLMLAMIFLIKLDSRGPVFFVQQRIGHRGRVFNMVKFRSMTNSSKSEDPEADITIQKDPRVTRIGRIIRPSRIDELPQLFNVLMGHMSLIGPRPETLKLSKHYEAEIPNYRYRHVVRPGITGWAQVRQGHVSTVGDVTEKLEYDFFYVKNISVWLDLLIVLKTFKVMLTGFGAK
ncbi:MAG: exopolysaccharide biosynthesis polyprenyl glycosylphosphotransferase [Pseudomonadota bacterium]